MRWVKTFKRRKQIDRLSYTLSGFFIGIMIGLLIGFWLNQPVDTEAEKFEQVVKGEQSGQEIIVERVIDGDTLILPGGEQVRLLGINTPEKNEPCFGQSRDRLFELVRGKNITLTKGSRDRDQYNRVLGWLWEEGSSINLTLVREGLARASVDLDMLLADELIAAEKEARERNFGCLWSALADDSSDEYIEIAYDEAPEWVGKRVSVVGEIDNIYRSSPGNIFINFCEAFRECPFSAVIFNTDSHRFDSLPDQTWVGESIRITGDIEEYEGRAEIKVIEPEQLQIIY